MAERDEIIAFCDELLEIGSFDDYGPNGLQVPGAAEVSVVATGVSANLDTLAGAADAGAQLILTHHGLFWESMPRSLSAQMAARLRLLLEGGISLAGYHLPLDAHPAVGNNALLCRALGFEPAEPFGEARGRAIGFAGRSDGVAAEALVERFRETLGRKPLVQGDGPDVVRSVGVVTVAGAGTIHEAVRRGLDALVTGEPAEHAMADAREGGLHFIAGGHYATETLGIRRLGELVAQRFRLRHEFIDVPNPV
jgi:dinuclear metal center YbgI/SA1388 family protein